MKTYRSLRVGGGLLIATAMLISASPASAAGMPPSPLTDSFDSIPIVSPASSSIAYSPRQVGYEAQGSGSHYLEVDTQFKVPNYSCSKTKEESAWWDGLERFYD